MERMEFMKTIHQIDGFDKKGLHVLHDLHGGLFFDIKRFNHALYGAPFKVKPTAASWFWRRRNNPKSVRSIIHARAPGILWRHDTN